MLAAMARVPGMSSQKTDACGSYPQRDLTLYETWAELPPHPWPKEWHRMYTRPVVRLGKAVYGMPNAGLVWGPHGKAALLKRGCHPVGGWVCLYNHESKGLFFSVCGRVQTRRP